MAAAGGAGGRRPWVVDVEKDLGEADASVEVSRWQRHCIYRVPACIKDLNRKAYKPQVVSLGPFHHGRDGELLPTEEHKRRALWHLLRRAKCTRREQTFDPRAKPGSSPGKYCAQD